MICAGEAIEGESVGRSCVSPVKRTNDVERKARGEEKREGKSSRNSARPAGTGVIVWESSLDDERTYLRDADNLERAREEQRQQREVRHLPGEDDRAERRGRRRDRLHRILELVEPLRDALRRFGHVLG